MAAWVVSLLAALVLLKPQEFADALSGLPLLYVAFAIAAAAAVGDVVRGRLRLSLAPQVPFVGAFLLHALLVTAVKRPDLLGETAITFAILASLFAAVAIGCATARGLAVYAAAIVACAAVVTVVAVDQSERPFGCFLAAPEDWEGRGELTADGRPCETAADCRADAPVPDGNYRCERVGLLKTATIGGRVRYRGSLADPNELSLMISATLPLALALAVRRRALPEVPRPGVILPPLLGDRLLRGAAALGRALPAAGLWIGVGAAVVLSQSRSGLIVFLAVAAVQIMRWSGPFAVVAGCLLGPPMLLLGGRSGAEAEDSADERVEILREAFEIIRRTKGFGLGVGQFSDESSIGMTAHNAYVLAAAETGLVGYLLFGFALYLSLKVPIALWFRGRAPGPGISRMAPALAISLGGLALGIVFLSWTYKDVLFLAMGASAALYSAARAEDPGFSVRISLRETAVVGSCLAGLLVAFYLGSRLHK